MGSFTTSSRRRLIDAAEKLGVMEQASAVSRRVNSTSRRNWQDDKNLRLLISLTLAEDANCVDVGAHSGDILEQIVTVAPNGKHVAVEPLPEQAAELQKQYPGVEVHQCALASEPGTAQFSHVHTNPQLSGLRDRGFEGEGVSTFDVEIKRLDEIVDPGREIQLIKVDVEGAELGVFEGGLATLERCRPTVVFEHGLGGANHFGTKSEEIHDLLVGQVGLRIFDIDGNGPFSRSEFAARFDELMWFWVAHR